MSRVVASRIFMLNSELGDIAIRSELVEEFDVETIIRNKAISQARVLQFQNVGRQIDENALLAPDAIPTVFKPNDEEGF